MPRYLGAERATWQAYDAVELITKLGKPLYPEILVDQGLADKFLHHSELLPELFETACTAAGQPLQLRRHEGYDRGYHFNSTFIEDHLRFHAATHGAP